MSHSDPIIPILAQFRPLFTAPTWKKMMILLTGTLLARGRRTVTAALYQTGHQLLFGLYSLVTLFGQALYPDGQLPLK